MSLYGKSVEISGIPCSLITRGTKNGEYLVIFEREFASLEQIEAINWRRPKLSGPCELPVGYGFDVKNIEYSMGTKSYAVTLTVREQYLGDVTGYQARVAELEGAVAEQTASIQEKDQTIQTQQTAILGYTASVAGLTAVMDTVAAVSTELSDSLALDMADLAPGCFPTWENVLQDGTELAQGRIIEKDGQLYRVVQTVTPQAHQEPGGEGMLAVYRPIDREHAGTPEDPIPWVYGMDCLAGLYYSYEGAVYRVADGGDMIPCVWAPDTPGLWQWVKIEEVS